MTTSPVTWDRELISYVLIQKSSVGKLITIYYIYIQVSFISKTGREGKASANAVGGGDTIPSFEIYT